MAKAPNISDAARMGQAIAAKASKAPRKAQPAAVEASGIPTYTTTTISLPEPLLEALQAVAKRRAKAGVKGAGRRLSVSAIIVEVLQQHLDDLDK